MSDNWNLSPIIEGFAIETVDGLIFTVKGLVHPPDRVIAYLRYVPHPQGDRVMRREDASAQRYQRVYHFQKQWEILETHAGRDIIAVKNTVGQHPLSDYVWRDPVFGIDLQGVPRHLIRAAHDPCTYLAALRQRGPADPLEEDALALATLLSARMPPDVRYPPDARYPPYDGLPPDAIGISGSLMLGLHQEDSDVDLIVYGAEVAQAVKQTLQRLLEMPSSPLRRPGPEELAALHAEHSPDTPLPFADFARLQARKVNELRFRGREVFVRFVKRATEVGERYGDRRFQTLGSATVQARVTDDRDAMFTPCRYAVTDVTILDGPTHAAADLRELVSFRGRFSDQARNGEWVIGRGNLERVSSCGAPDYYRLSIGGQAGDYLSTRAGD